jgi:DNA-directed RNA polymerase specialized sigma24 family protein
MTKDDPWERVLKKAEAVRRAQVELRSAILEARTAGLSLADIGQAADLTRQRVHQIIREAESDA